MIFKLLWAAILFIAITGSVFLASFGFEVPVSYYEKHETIIATEPKS